MTATNEKLDKIIAILERIEALLVINPPTLPKLEAILADHPPTLPKLEEILADRDKH